MKDENFKNSRIYKQGEFYLKLGALLTNPKTSVETLAIFAREHGLQFDYRILPAQEQPEGDGE